MRRGLHRLLPLLLAGCIGGATETETGTALIKGKVQWTDGSPVANARVALRPDDFVADSSGSLPRGGGGSWDTATGASGRFAFRKSSGGAFAVEAQDGEGHAALLRFTIAASADRVDLDPLVLRPTVHLIGRVRFADSSLYPAFVQVPGTVHSAAADSATGAFDLRGMPQGDFDLRVSTALPFFPTKEFPALLPDGPASVDVGDLILEKALKQGFSVSGGVLSLDGIGAGNPVLYDNDFCSNTWDNEFLWALASMGRIDLRGSIATRIKRDSSAVLPEDFSAWAREAEICRLSGMRDIPRTLLGATRKLALPAGGRWEDIVPESNPGIELLLAEARKASAAKPLIVLEGGAPTTIADAILLDPSIADKMVVFGIYNQDLNGRDTLATFLVAMKCRFVEWGRDYRWAGPGPSGVSTAGNWLGARLAASRDTTKAVKDFFADFAGLSFLVDARAWKGARGANLAAPPMNVKPGVQGPFDFVDIPKEANDWAVMDSAFFAILGDSTAYHPWPVPGTIAGVSFRDMSGVSADSVAGEGDIARDIGPGDWMDFPLEPASEGDYDLALRYQCDAQARIRAGGPDDASPVDLQLAAGAAWNEARIRIHLKRGPQSLRLSTAEGAWKLGRLRMDAAP